MLLMAVGVAGTLVAIAAFGVAFKTYDKSPREIADFADLNATAYEAAYAAACDEDTGYARFDDDYCYVTRTSREAYLDAAPWLCGIMPLFALALTAMAHVGSYAFLDPNICVGAFPLLALGLMVLPIVAVMLLNIPFGGVMPGTDSAKLWNWNLLELLAAQAWLGAAVNPISALLAAFERAARFDIVSTASMVGRYNPTWPPSSSTGVSFFLGFRCTPPR